LAFVPNLALKIWMQFGPHCGVAALAERVPTVLTPPTMVSIAATARTFLLMDMTSSFLEPRPSLRTAVVLSLNLRLKCCVDTLPAARLASLAAAGVRIRQLASATGQA
jgi:hypothetical protein